MCCEAEGEGCQSGSEAGAEEGEVSWFRRRPDPVLVRAEKLLWDLRALSGELRLLEERVERHEREIRELERVLCRSRVGMSSAPSESMTTVWRE